MTQNEIEEFKTVIANTIMQNAINMTEEQIQNTIDLVSKENKNLPFGFSNMLYEQILLMKYKN